VRYLVTEPAIYYLHPDRCLPPS